MCYAVLIIPRLDANAKQILETEGYRLYENSNPMGRLTLVHRVAGFAENEREFINIIRKGFDYSPRPMWTAAEFETARRFLDILRACRMPGPYRKDRRSTQSQLFDS